MRIIQHFRGTIVDLLRFFEGRRHEKKINRGTIVRENGE